MVKGAKRRRAGEGAANRDPAIQVPSMAPDSMRRSLIHSGHGIADTFPAHICCHEPLLGR